MVTGASRGLGKGIAIALGEAGATVYVTGRSGAGAQTSHLGGSVEETAAAVGGAGGTGVPAPCDHRDDGAVEALFERVVAEAGRLDVLVNNVWGGYEGLHAGASDEWQRPFWEQPPDLWDSMFGAGVRAHYVASVIGARAMVAAGGGLVVNVSHITAERLTAGDNVAYSVAKSADVRMARDMATQLRPHGVAALALYPGLVRTEGILQWSEYLDLSASESPAYTGRAVAALAADTDVTRWSGRALFVADLAQEYGFTDTDGTQPGRLQPAWQ